MEIKTTEEIMRLSKDYFNGDLTEKGREKYHNKKWILKDDVRNFIKEEVNHSGSTTQILEEFDKQIKK